MVMKYICVHGSIVSGICNLHVPARTWTGTVDTVSGELTVSGVQTAVVGDSGATDCGHRFTIMTGVSYFTAPNGKSYSTTDDTVQIQGTPLLPHLTTGSGTINTGNPLLQIDV
jgi:hypothetical protein